MAKVFKTTADNPDSVDIVGVGVLGAHGQGGIVVEQAAAAGMAELQKRDKDGTLVQKDGVLVPLASSALNDAAKLWAEGVPGVEIVDVRQDDLAGLRYQDGTPVPEYPSAGAKAEQEAADMEVDTSAAEAQAAAAEPAPAPVAAAAAEQGGQG